MEELWCRVSWRCRNCSSFPRDVLLKYRNSELALLKIDFKNAFNLLNRETFVQATSKMFPGLERWTWWCYNQSPLLVYNHENEFFSESGVQQGDPLGPLYFCCGLQLQGVASPCKKKSRGTRDFVRKP